MRNWLRRKLRRLQRRWIADAAERTAHEAIVRERLRPTETQAHRVQDEAVPE